MKKVVNLIPEYDSMLARRCDALCDADRETFDKYYRLYEYTDDVTVLEDDPGYPGLANYVKTGILTKEEMINALLM